MRIAFINRTALKVGGAETYVENALSELSHRGHVVSLWTEPQVATSSPKLSIPEGALVKVGLEGLDLWKPDVIFSSGVDSYQFEKQLLDIGYPTVLFLHGYHGTCISGAKVFQFPALKPCSRRFGPACLLNYFPRRCGGLNPFTMFDLYHVQSHRLALLSRYQGLVVASEHMALEYEKHGLQSTVIPYWPEGPSSYASCPSTSIFRKEQFAI